MFVIEQQVWTWEAVSMVFTGIDRPEELVISPKALELNRVMNSIASFLPNRPQLE